MKLWQWFCYKFLAKYNLQDTARGFNGNVNALRVFTPATNKNPPTDWKGNRVEVEERKPKNYREGSLLNRDFSFKLLDADFLNDVDQVGIHQLWSGGNPLPKYFAFIQKYNDKLYFKVRHAKTGRELVFSEHYEIETGKQYHVNVLVKVSNELKGNIYVAVNGVEIMNLDNCQTQDKEHPLLEKFGMYWNKGAGIAFKKYPATLNIRMRRRWL